MPFGAVYFRKSNPPREDWEQDYREAAKIGINAFRHWFMWSAIEVAPGVYDWDDYDRQLDLAAKYWIRTIAAEILGTAPEWAFREYPHAMVHDKKGKPIHSFYRDACAIAGMPGLCFDNEEVFLMAEDFMKALILRYKDHPAMGGYDVWNEQNTNGSSGGCYCEASAEKFRAWLKGRYQDLETLSRAWHRYSYRDLEKGTYQAFRAAAMVDGYGNSGGCNHEEWSDYRWAHWLISDTTRSVSGGKPFWAAEVPGGFTWRKHGNPPMDRGRMSTAGDIYLHHMMHMASGATGVFSPRWRPLLNGTFTGHFAYYDMDGSPTDRSEMVSRMAKWANDPKQEELWTARPVKGDIGMVVVPESQIQCVLLEGSGKQYYHAIAGAYQDFLFNNLQVDFVNFDQISTTDMEVLYLPHPLMLPGKVAADLKEFVRKGGILISEGCPAYFGDHGRAGEHQPNYGLDELFGAREHRVQFTPDLLEDLTFNADGIKVSGGVYLQAYIADQGEVSETYEDGSPAMVDHRFGQGRTRLIGTSPGYGIYEEEEDADSRRFFGQLFNWTGRKQHVACSDFRLVARLHQAGDLKVLWIINSAIEEVKAGISLPASGAAFDQHEVLVSKGSVRASGPELIVSVPARDAMVVKLT